VKEFFLQTEHICQIYPKNKSDTFLWPTVYEGLRPVVYKFYLFLSCFLTFCNNSTTLCLRTIIL